MTKTKQGISLFTHEQVCEIRRNPGGLTQVQLAKKFDVSQPAISNVQRYKTYRDVTCK